MKGSNPFTEHYSALRAEFELPHDPATSLNQNLVNVLKHADKVAICGEAISHCVNYTVRDLVDAWPADRMHDLVLLTDCMSPVPGFEAAGEAFLKDMAAKGVTLMTSQGIPVVNTSQVYPKRLMGSRTALHNPITHFMSIMGIWVLI
ncbi:hypothetical protein PINS_up005048 [Pythium insidiosum]|nr:hypothetical protein PINS_up005048 [Pythium insidiosum]